jgi:cytochrome c-type biogenesis protein CcmH/NrfF
MWSMSLGDEAPGPILPETNEVFWSSLVGFFLLLVLVLLVLATWVLVRYIRRTRSIAEEALGQATQRRSETGIPPR